MTEGQKKKRRWVKGLGPYRPKHTTVLVIWKDQRFSDEEMAELFNCPYAGEVKS